MGNNQEVRSPRQLSMPLESVALDGLDEEARRRIVVLFAQLLLDAFKATPGDDDESL